MFRMLKVLLVIVAGSLAVSCETADPVQRLPSISFAHKPAIRLDVGTIETVSTYVSPLKAPNVEHQFSVTPEDALRQWAKDRLVAVGMAGRAVFTITKASVRVDNLKRTEGVRGVFTTDQAERYTADIEAVIEVKDAGAQGTGYAEARVSLSRTIAENATLHEREKFWFDLTRDVANNFDSEMESVIKRHLVNWLR